MRGHRGIVWLDFMNEKRPWLSLCHTKHAEASSLLASLLVSAAGVKAIDMGLGWMLNKDNHHQIWHSGDSDSFSSY